MKEAYLAEIKLEAIDLPIGSTLYAVCPFCKHIPGANNGQAKLSITRTEAGILYNCFRASCKRGRGFIGDIGKQQKPSKNTSRKNRVYEGRLEPISSSERLKILFGCSVPIERYTEQGIKYAPEVNRIYFPIFDARGYQIGENLKTTISAKPKNLINKFTDNIPLLHFPLTPTLYPTIVLVEDHISAIKINMIADKIKGTPVALLGTHLSDEAIKYLIDIGMKQAIVFLDGDAIKSALKMKSKLDMLVPTRILPLPVGTDPKDIELVELEDMLK